MFITMKCQWSLITTTSIPQCVDSTVHQFQRAVCQLCPFLRQMTVASFLNKKLLLIMTTKEKKKTTREWGGGREKDKEK